MSVKLLYTSPLWLISNGIRQSHDTTNKADSYWLGGMGTECPYCGSNKLEESLSVYGCNVTSICKDCGANLQTHIGEKDYNLIKRVGFKFKHESVLEHSLIVFEFEASRALLQELSRHRIGVSPTIKSTRYTLKELKKEKPFTWIEGREEVYKRAAKYLYMIKDDNNTVYNAVNHDSIKALENLRRLVVSGFSNDRVKYILPEAYKFKGQISFNLRSLMHLLTLRLAKDVLLEFRILSLAMLSILPDDYKNLLRQNDQLDTLEDSLGMQLTGMISNLPKIYTVETNDFN